MKFCTKIGIKICAILLLDSEQKMCYNKRLSKKRRDSCVIAPPKRKRGISASLVIYFVFAFALLRIAAILRATNSKSTSGLSSIVVYFGTNSAPVALPNRSASA
jgi:hypothetical protein